MMVKYVMPTTTDIEGGIRPKQVQEAIDSNYVMPSLNDMGIVAPQKSPDRELFANKTLKVGPFDTGVNLSPRAFQELAGAGKAFADAGRGIRQLFGQYPEAEQQANAAIDEPLERLPAARSGALTADIAMGLGIPVRALSSTVGKGIAKAGLPRVGSRVSDSLVADATLTGAAMSQLKPLEKEQSRLAETAKGGLWGMAGAAALTPFVRTGGKVVGAVRNDWANPTAKELDELARAYGIELSPGDLPGNEGWRMFENATEAVPLSGRTPNLIQQAGQMQDALYDLRANLKPDLTVRDAAGNQLAQYDDVNHMMVGEIQRNFADLNKQKDALFDNVGKVIEANPNVKKVELTQTRKQVKELLDSHPQIFDQFKDIDSPLINRLAGLDKNLSSAAPILDAAGNPIQRTARASYDDAQWLRKRLGAITEAAKKRAATGALTDDAAGQLKLVYGAVNRDLDNWGAQATNKPVHDAYKTAQKFYTENVVPFKKDPVLKKVVNEFREFDPDTASKEFFKQDLKNRAKTLMKFQTPEGKKAMQYALVDRLANKGLDRDSIKISEYLNEVKRMQAPSEAVLDPQVAKHVGDLHDIFAAGNRAENFLDSSGNTARYAAIQGLRTGSSLAAPSLVGAAGMAGGVPAAAVTGGVMMGALGLTRALNEMGVTKAGKRLLMANSRLPGGLGRLSDAAIARAAGPGLREYLTEPAPLPEIDYMK